MPDLRQLRTFVAVATELNFTRAAERLSVGQQAVSKTLGGLEAELGVQLVERTTREVTLTAAGEALLAAGRPALVDVDAAFAAAVGVGQGLTGTVRVGCSPAIGPRERADLIAALRDGTPAVTVSIEDARPRDAARRVLDRELDLVLTRTVEGDPGAEAVPLRPTPLVLCVPARHRLAAGAPVPLAALDGERLLVWSPPGTAYTDLLLDRIAAAGATVEPIESRVMGGGSLPELVDLDAVALMPEGWQAQEGVAQVPLAEPATLPLLLVWRAGSVPPAVRRVRAAMSSGP